MKKIFLLFLILTVLNMLVIFMFSAQDGDRSGDISKEITENVVSDKNLDDNTFDKAEVVIRKLAHFSLFACLGILVFCSLKTCGQFKSNKAVLILTIIICVLYAASDEFHQKFIDGRDCRITDVLIDSAGSLTGMGASFFADKRIILWRAKKSGI